MNHEKREDIDDTTISYIDKTQKRQTQKKNDQTKRKIFFFGKMI